MIWDMNNVKYDDESQEWTATFTVEGVTVQPYATGHGDTFKEAMDDAHRAVRNIDLKEW